MSSIVMDPSPTATQAVDDQGVQALGTAARLRVVVDVLKGLQGEVLGAAVGDAELLDSMVALQRVETMVFAEKLRRAAAISDRHAHLIDGARTTADLMAARCGLSRAEACSQVETAVALTHMPGTAAKLAEGRLSSGQAHVAARSWRDLEAARAAADAAAAGEHGGERGASGGDADDDDQEGSPSGDDARDAAARGREREEAAERERAWAEREAALDAAVAGSRASDRNELRRDLDDWAHRQGLDRLAAAERAAHANRRLWMGKTSEGVMGIQGGMPILEGTRVLSVLDAMARPCGPDDTRTLAQRRCDALIGLAARAAHPQQGRDGASPEDGSPEGGSPEAEPWQAQQAAPQAQVLLVTYPDALHEVAGAEPSQLDGAGAVSGATARQLCCDAEVTTVTLGRNGAVLDVGRTRRVPSARQRAAVIARDRACIGCGAPVARCQVHHIRFWSQGGATDLDNLCLCCWNCHFHIHQHRWEVHRDHHGKFAITRPSDQRLAG